MNLKIRYGDKNERKKPSLKDGNNDDGVSSTTNRNVERWDARRRRLRRRPQMTVTTMLIKRPRACMQGGDVVRNRDEEGGPDGCDEQEKRTKEIY